MPALADIGKYKRLAELYALAMATDTMVTAAKKHTALNCLREHGLSDRQAETFLDAALAGVSRGMLRSIEQTLGDVSTAFRVRDHAFILAQIQAILEAGDISDEVQAFYDLCTNFLYHEGQ